MTPLKLSILALGLGFSNSATAACPYIQEAIEHKVKEYRSIENRNLEIFHRLTENENNCLTQGASLSGKVASLTAGNSCSVTSEVATLSDQLGKLGAFCRENAKKMKEVHLVIEVAHKEAAQDIQDSLDYAAKSEILRSECGKELKDSVTLRDSFTVLGLELLKVETQAKSGQENYGKFAKLSQEIEKISAGRGAGCGSLSSAITSIASAKNIAPSLKNSPALTGMQPNEDSDITGTNKEKSKMEGSANPASVKAPMMMITQQDSPLIPKIDEPYRLSLARAQEKISEKSFSGVLPKKPLERKAPQAANPTSPLSHSAGEALWVTKVDGKEISLALAISEPNRAPANQEEITRTSSSISEMETHRPLAKEDSATLVGAAAGEAAERVEEDLFQRVRKKYQDRQNLQFKPLEMVAHGNP